MENCQWALGQSLRELRWLRRRAERRRWKLRGLGEQTHRSPQTTQAMKVILGITALVAVAIAIPLVIYNRTDADLRRRTAVLRDQTQHLNQLLAENERLSKAAASNNLRSL